jgi:formylglycine-generating enzyme required for sulfatase activity
LPGRKTEIAAKRGLARRKKLCSPEEESSSLEITVKLSCSLFILLLPGFSTHAQTRPGLGLQIVGGASRLTLSAEAGSPCTIQYATNLAGPTTWLTLSNVTVGSNPALVSDQTAPLTNRFFRAVINVPSNTVWISPGGFTMGSPVTESQRGPNSETQHTVTLTKGFFMARFFVTQAAYRSLINTNPSYFNTNRGFTLDLNRPVEQVSWADATNFCGLLTQQERLAGRLFNNWVYRLPTEAEWEYACRAGTTTPLYCGPNLTNGLANFDARYAYYSGSATATNDPSGTLLNRSSAVGSYPANARGLYDMTGNLWEWCQDWYATFAATSLTDPQGPSTGTQRALRGGAFNDIGAICRSASRNKTSPALGANTIGFRVVAVGP